MVEARETAAAGGAPFEGGGLEPWPAEARVTHYLSGASAKCEVSAVA